MEIMEKQVSIPITVLIGIITFLLGGYFGDWKASFDLKETIQHNTEIANQAQRQIAVVSNSITNIEKSIDRIEADLKSIKNE
jgi:hypothetical protein